MSRRVDLIRYEAFCRQILIKSGFADEDAAEIAAIMIENEKLGISTHGSFHMITYLKKIRAGSIDPRGKIQTVAEGATWANIDAGHNLGFLASSKAMRLAMEKARVHGMAIVTVKNSSHYGSGAPYELMAARAGMAAIVCSNTWRLMAVPGSRGKVIGNSPIGYGLPAGKEPPVFMDIATSAGSLTKVIRCAESGEQTENGWIVDENGVPTTDPTVKNYSLVPVGAHKGYGFAFLVEALTGMLSGGCCLGEVGDDWITHIEVVPNVCHAFLVIDLEQILGKGVFEKRIDHCIQEIHCAAKADGADRIYVPGEIEADHQRKVEKEGLVLMDVHIKRMAEISKMLDIDMENIFLD